MSFLDDLKKEAEQVKERDRHSLSNTQIQRNDVLESVRPRLRKLYEYLRDACEQLNVVDPDVHVTYEMRGLGKIGPLRQREYKVAADDPNNLDKFTLSFECARDDKIRFEVKGLDSAKAMKEYLWSCNLRFSSKATAAGDGVFLLEAFVPVTLEFEADFSGAKIVLLVRNLDNLGQSRTVYDPDMIDADFMEELAKCIVRKDHRFHELSGNTMSKEARSRLREQLEQQNQSFQGEGAGSKKAPAARKKKKKKGLLRSLFGG